MFGANKRLRDLGYIWNDPKEENVGRIINDIDFNGNSYHSGDIVIIDLEDFAYVGEVTPDEVLEEVNYPLTLNGETGMHQLTYNEYEDKVASGDPFIVVIEREGCGYCTMYMPVLEEIAKENDLIVFATYAMPHAPMGGLGLYGDECATYFFALHAGKEKSVGVTFGSPYIYYYESAYILLCSKAVSHRLS